MEKDTFRITSNEWIAKSEFKLNILKQICDSISNSPIWLTKTTKGMAKKKLAKGSNPGGSVTKIINSAEC